MEEEVNRLPEAQRDMLRAKIKEKVQAKPSVLEGKMTLDPVLDYAVTEAEGILGNEHDLKLKFKRKAHREQSERDLVLCDSIVSSHVGKDFLQEETFTFTGFKSESVSDDIFYLSHYNFPEFIGVAPPAKKPLWLYILVAALAFLVLSVVLRRVWKRASSRAIAK